MNPRRVRRALALAAAVTGVGAAAVWLAERPADATASAPEASADGLLPVETLRVAAVDRYAVDSRYAGRVVSRRTSPLGFERGGLLVAVSADEGDRVEPGQVLARLDTRELAARRRELAAHVRAARARVGEIEARLSLARVTSERRRMLLERDSISAQQYDEARFQHEAVAAELAAARAEIASAESARESVDVALALSRLEAPYAGSITARQVDEGTVVSPGQPILTLVEDGVLEVRVGIPPDVAAGLVPGSRHDVEITGRDHPVRLDALLETVATDTRTVTAVFHFEAPPEGVRDGQLARVAMRTEVREPGFWLPVAALTESRRGLWSVYALSEPGAEPEPGVLRVERRELQVLHAEGDRVFVRGTLRDGEAVVAGGVHRLVPGQRVRLARTDARAVPARD